jgi:hypothetical protein
MRLAFFLIEVALYSLHHVVSGAEDYSFKTNAPNKDCTTNQGPTRPPRHKQTLSWNQLNAKFSEEKPVATWQSNSSATSTFSALCSGGSSHFSEKDYPTLDQAPPTTAKKALYPRVPKNSKNSSGLTPRKQSAIPIQDLHKRFLSEIKSTPAWPSSQLPPVHHDYDSNQRQFSVLSNSSHAEDDLEDILPAFSSWDASSTSNLDYKRHQNTQDYDNAFPDLPSPPNNQQSLKYVSRPVASLRSNGKKKAHPKKK